MTIEKDLLAKQPCAICRTAGKTAPCPGHTPGNTGDSTSGTAELSRANTDKSNNQHTLNPEKRLDKETSFETFKLIYDKESNIFKLELQPGNHSPKDQEELERKMQNIWDAFRKEHGLTSSEFDVQKKTNGSVTTHTYLIPAHLFNAFIQKLSGANLLSQLNVDKILAEKDGLTQSFASPFRTNPFKTRPER